MKTLLSLFCIIICSALHAQHTQPPITFDQYKELVKHVQKENKYEGLIHVVPTARSQYEHKIEERPETFSAYGASIQSALKSVVEEKEQKAGIKTPSQSLSLPGPNPKTEAQHKKLVAHALEELNVERKLKRPELYSETSVSTLNAELSSLKKNRPAVPLEVTPVETESEEKTSAPSTILSHLQKNTQKP
ncbi:MAG: hypothetical protein K2X53_01860 [Alphaproteobacteria bacterium]|nr:hypothetical protein [Alphaproteobacteria bacterium]